jgi:hypothetical protein
VQYSVLWSAPGIGSTSVGTRRGLKPHESGQPPRAVPSQANRFQHVSGGSLQTVAANGGGAVTAATLGTCVALLLLRPPAANKPKALSAASGD